MPLFVFHHCLSCYFLFLFLLMLSKYAWQEFWGQAFFLENHAWLFVRTRFCFVLFCFLCLSLLASKWGGRLCGWYVRGVYGLKGCFCDVVVVYEMIVHIVILQWTSCNWQLFNVGTRPFIVFVQLDGLDAALTQFMTHINRTNLAPDSSISKVTNKQTSTKKKVRFCSCTSMIILI